MIHNSTCLNQKDKLHRVVWEYRSHEVGDDYESITFDGKCTVCDIEFQKTYSNPRLSIISKTSREVSNFEHIVDHLN